MKCFEELGQTINGALVLTAYCLHSLEERELLDWRHSLKPNFDRCSHFQSCAQSHLTAAIQITLFILRGKYKR